MEDLSDLERQVISTLLQAGGGARESAARQAHALAILREQMESLSVKDRKLTGVGFFTHLSLPENSPKVDLPRRVVLGDLAADFENLVHGAGFNLFIVNGLLSTLEGFSFDEAWPATPKLRRLYFVPEK